MDQSSNEKSRFSGSHWTDEEKRYLVSHKTDGAALIAEALGRTIVSVQVMACRMHVSLRQVDGPLCPKCGTYRVRPGTYAGRHGLCVVCWERERARALSERRAFKEARREYEREKWRRRA